MTGLPGFAPGAGRTAGLHRPVDPPPPWAQLIRLILRSSVDWPPWPCFPRLVRHWA